MNCKTWDITLAEVMSAPGVLISGDEEVAAHWDDDTALCVLQYIDPVEDIAGISIIAQGNKVVGHEDNGSVMYGMRFRYVSSWGAAAEYAPLKAGETGAHCLYTNANGDIGATLSTQPLPAGRYRLMFMW